MNENRYFGYRSFEPEYETMKEVRKRGIDTVTGFPYSCFMRYLQFFRRHRMQSRGNRRSSLCSDLGFSRIFWNC